MAAICFPKPEVRTRLRIEISLEIWYAYRFWPSQTSSVTNHNYVAFYWACSGDTRSSWRSGTERSGSFFPLEHWAALYATEWTNKHTFASSDACFSCFRYLSTPLRSNEARSSSWNCSSSAFSVYTNEDTQSCTGLLTSH